MRTDTHLHNAQLINMQIIEFYICIRCPNGFVKTTDGKACEPMDECANNDCLKDSSPCRLTTAAKLCSCSDNNTDCQPSNHQSFPHFINFNTIAISTIIVCVLNIPRQLTLIGHQVFNDILFSVIIALIMIYIRYKRRADNESDSSDEPTDESRQSCDKSSKSERIDKEKKSSLKSKSKSKSKRVRLDPRSVVINMDNCDQELDKSSLSES